MPGKRGGAQRENLVSYEAEGGGRASRRTKKTLEQKNKDKGEKPPQRPVAYTLTNVIVNQDEGSLIRCLVLAHLT